MNRHISSAIAHERDIDATRRAQPARLRRSLGEHPHGTLEFPPFVVPTVREITPPQRVSPC